MPGAGIEDQLRAARLEIDTAGQWLVSASADSLDRCARVLETVGRQVAGLQPQLLEGDGTGDARNEARRLHASLRRASRLLEGAADFHFNWGRLRDTLCAGYTPGGEPATPPPRKRISIQG